MIVHFKAIEDTFLMMEQCYGLKLTDGLESFLVSVFNRIIAEYRMGLTRYQMDVSREELIRRGKWRLMQMSLREWDDDDDERESHWLYIRAEVYDGFIREIFEPYGKVEFFGEKYVLRITGAQACSAASAGIEERWGDLVCRKEPNYPDVRAVYYSLMRDCLNTVKGIFYWLNKAEKEETVEVQGAKYFCDDPQCGEEEYAWYETVRCVWMKFIEFIQKVYQDYGAGRPEIVLYDPYNLKKEGIPPTYRQFLLDCLE